MTTLFERPTKSEHIIRKNDKYYLNDKEITDENTLNRIRKLCIPPNWTDVKIAKDSTDYLQVTAYSKKDPNKKTQYIYHPLFIELTKSEKYDRLKTFIKKLPLLIKYVSKKLSTPIDLENKEYIIALMFRILLKTHSRIGNDCYADDNGTFGLTTLLKKHLTIIGDEICLSFVGKKSIKQKLIFTDKKCAAILNQLRKLPNERLFKTKDGDEIKSTDMNDQLKEIMGSEAFTCKDFRTYSANNLFLMFLMGKNPSDCIKKNISECYEEVACELGHTKAICKSSYICPLIAEQYIKDPVKFVERNPTLLEILK